MKVALLTEPLKFQVAEETMPEPGPGEVRIQVKAAGIAAQIWKRFQAKHPGDGVLLTRFVWDMNWPE